MVKQWTGNPEAGISSARLTKKFGNGMVLLWYYLLSQDVRKT